MHVGQIIYSLSTNVKFLNNLSPYTFHLIVKVFAEMLRKAKPQVLPSLSGPGRGLRAIPLTHALSKHCIPLSKPLTKNTFYSSSALLAEVTAVRQLLG